MPYDCIELTTKHFVHLFAAAVLTECFIQKAAVHHGFMLELLGDAVQPAALRRGPAIQVVDALHGAINALIKGLQCFAQCGFANVGHDTGGDVLVALVTPGCLECCF